MAGTLHGSIDHNITVGNRDCARNIFAAVINYFNSRFTRIASQKGTTVIGTGALEGYHSDANASGDNAFAVYRWDRADGKKLYILVQWNYNSSMGASPGNPATPNQVNFGVGIQFAMRLDGGNPWNGTSNNDLLDTKNATNVWVAGGSTLVVWPRTNGPGGSSTAKSGLGVLANYGGSGARFSIMSDDDSIYWFSDTDRSNSVDVHGFFMPYTPRNGITSDLPYACMMYNGVTPDYNSLVGSTGGVAGFEGGAVIMAADGVRSFRMQSLSTHFVATAFQPNPLLTPAAYDIFELSMRMDDATVPQKFGLFGKLNSDDLGNAWNMPLWDTNVGKTRICTGTTTLAEHKWVFRWDGATTPNSTVSQTGVQF